MITIRNICFKVNSKNILRARNINAKHNIGTGVATKKTNS